MCTCESYRFSTFSCSKDGFISYM
uniref:Uncharacterized protein n=1 Tax=Anguilla anguilla TaxID=7936 RepID=A0A0E9UZX8_ANGAN